jgi:hypothetical protein
LCVQRISRILADIRRVPFAPRGEFALEKCVSSSIALKKVAPDHFSACLRIQLQEIDLAPARFDGDFLQNKSTLQDEGRSKLEG